MDYKRFHYKCLAQSKILHQGLTVSIWPCHFRQVFFLIFISILMIWKQTGSYIYQLLSWKLSFDAACSEKE